MSTSNLAVQLKKEKKEDGYKFSPYKFNNVSFQTLYFKFSIIIYGFWILPLILMEVPVISLFFFRFFLF